MLKTERTMPRGDLTFKFAILMTDILDAGKLSTRKQMFCKMHEKVDLVGIPRWKAKDWTGSLRTYLKW